MATFTNFFHKLSEYVGKVSLTRISSWEGKDLRSAGATGTWETTVLTVLMALADMGYLVIFVLNFFSSSQNTLKVFDIILNTETKIFITQVPTFDKTFSSRLLNIRKF